MQSTSSRRSLGIDTTPRRRTITFAGDVPTIGRTLHDLPILAGKCPGSEVQRRRPEILTFTGIALRSLSIPILFCDFRLGSFGGVDDALRILRVLLFSLPRSGVSDDLLTLYVCGFKPTHLSLHRTIRFAKFVADTCFRSKPRHRICDKHSCGNRQSQAPEGKRLFSHAASLQER